jgi:hypothetical protein
MASKFTECPICLDDKLPKWNAVTTCAMGHSFCKPCADKMIVQGKHDNCPLCRTPMFRPAYYPEGTFDAKRKRLPSVALADYYTIDLTGAPAPKRAKSVSMQSALLAVARRLAAPTEGALTITQLKTPEVISELREATGRFKGRTPMATVRRLLQQLRAAGVVRFDASVRGRYTVEMEERD